MRIRVLNERTMVSSFDSSTMRRLLGLLAIVTVVLGGTSAWADDFVLVRNAKNNSSAISKGEAKEMAIGKKKTWPNGTLALLVLPAAGTPQFAWFASVVCGASEGNLMGKIKQEVFKGEMRKPVIAAGDSEVVSAVAGEDGALGVIRADAVKTLPPSVVVVLLN